MLLNPKYASILTPRSLALNKAIVEFLDGLPADTKRAGPFRPILNLLLSMGLRTEAVRELVGDDTLEGPYRRRLLKLVGAGWDREGVPDVGRDLGDPPISLQTAQNGDAEERARQCDS